MTVRNVVNLGRIGFPHRDYCTGQDFVKNVKENKPIAVLTHKLSYAIDFMRENKKLREINGAKRRLVGEDGQVYCIITEPMQLRGLEISDFIIVPGAGLSPHFAEMYDWAQAIKR